MIKTLPQTLRLTAALLGIGAVSLANAHAGAVGKMVYYMNYADTPSGTHYQIYIINADGTGNTRITHPDTDDLYPALSPDGTLIAYRSSYNPGIRLTDPTGATISTIPNTDDCIYPAWSPDGKKIAALGQDAGGTAVIATINVDGSGRINRPLGDAGYFYGGVIGWSPDGTKLVYTEEAYVDSSSKPALYTASADGSGTPTKLSSDANSEYSNPSWSPDGTKILVQKRGTNYGFFLVDPDTGVETPVGSPVVAGEHPTWSPDGKQIAFESEADDSYGDIAIVNLDGTGLHTIRTIGQANFVQWSAAGGFTGGGTTPPVAGAPVITSTSLGTITLGKQYNYTITTDGSVAIAKFSFDVLPSGLSLNTGTGEIFGVVQPGNVPEYTSITITATSTKGVSTSKDFPLTFASAPTGKYLDLTGSLTGSPSVKLVSAKGKVKITGTVSLQNLGTKALNSKKALLPVGVYLSNSATFGSVTDAGLVPLAVNATYAEDSQTVTGVKIKVPAAGTTPALPALPVPLSKAGKAGDRVAVNFNVTASASDLPAQVLAGKYRYVLIVLDPLDTLKDADRSNNAASVDLLKLLGGN